MVYFKDDHWWMLSSKGLVLLEFHDHKVRPQISYMAVFKVFKGLRTVSWALFWPGRPNPQKLWTLALIWTPFVFSNSFSSKVSIKLLDLISSMDTWKTGDLRDAVKKKILDSETVPKYGRRVSILQSSSPSWAELYFQFCPTPPPPPAGKVFKAPVKPKL